jgi:hypothetical protein
MGAFSLPKIIFVSSKKPLIRFSPSSKSNIFSIAPSFPNKLAEAGVLPVSNKAISSTEPISNATKPVAQIQILQPSNENTGTTLSIPTKKINVREPSMIEKPTSTDDTQFVPQPWYVFGEDNGIKE